MKIWFPDLTWIPGLEGQFLKPEVIPQWTAEAMIFNPETGVSENRVAASLIGVHLHTIPANYFFTRPDLMTGYALSTNASLDE